MEEEITEDGELGKKESDYIGKREKKMKEKKREEKKRNIFFY